MLFVYDLGGGTFDVTVVSISDDADKNEISVVCTEDGHELGGKDWDDQIVRFLVSEFRNQIGSEENILEIPDTEYDLRRKAEQSNKLLSRTEKDAISFTHEGQRFRTELSRKKFNELTQDLLERTIEKTDAVLKLAEE
jgi:molecular chaperone DnaK (HSP70)